MNMTIEKLNKIKSENQELVMIRKLIAEKGEEMAAHCKYRKQILVCGGTGCTSSGCKKVAEALEKEIADNKLEDILVVNTGCFGL